MKDGGQKPEAGGQRKAVGGRTTEGGGGKAEAGGGRIRTAETKPIAGNRVSSSPLLPFPLHPHFHSHFHFHPHSHPHSSTALNPSSFES